MNLHFISVGIPKNCFRIRNILIVLVLVLTTTVEIEVQKNTVTRKLPRSRVSLINKNATRPIRVYCHERIWARSYAERSSYVIRIVADGRIITKIGASVGTRQKLGILAL